MGRLFIFQLTCTANSACQLPIKTLDELTNNGNATVVEFASFDSGPNIECDGVDIVKMSKIFATQHNISMEKVPFDQVSIALRGG